MSSFLSWCQRGKRGGGNTLKFSGENTSVSAQFKNLLICFYVFNMFVSKTKSIAASSIVSYIEHFCHKLVHINIFSDVYFHKYRTINTFVLLFPWERTRSGSTQRTILRFEFEASASKLQQRNSSAGRASPFGLKPLAFVFESASRGVK